MKETLSLTALSLSLAALGGSLHCAAMCGPIRLLCPQTRYARCAYQAGRAAAYAGLGAMAGYVGWSVPWWTLLISVALLAALTFFGGHLPKSWQRARSMLLTRAAARPFSLGLVSGLLPCGLLHAWILVAAASGSPLTGALTLGALWLGTLPALEIGTWLVAKPVVTARRRFPRAVPFTILVLALVPALWRSHFAWAQAKDPKAVHGCHGMAMNATAP